MSRQPENLRADVRSTSIKRIAAGALIVVFLAALPLAVNAQEGGILSLIQQVLSLQRKVVDLFTSDTFFINPALKRVGIGTKEPVATLDVNDASAAADTSLVVRYLGPIGHRAALVLSNRGAGDTEGSSSIWTIAAGNNQTGVLGQRLGISGHSGNNDPSYKFMLDLSGNLELGSEAMPSGITLYDTATKKPYCIRVANGVLTPSAGACP